MEQHGAVNISPQNYNNIVVLTGAGISKASGVPTFRGTGGLWNDSEAEKLLQIEELYRNPDRVWHYLSKLKKIMLEATPNHGHEALARLEANAKGYWLLTQNIDGLHQKAGSKNVIELHGSLLKTKCMNKACPSSAFEDLQIHERTPVCSDCGGKLRPDIVFFNENLGRNGRLAEAVLAECDLFMAIGTSGIVVPAAYYVQHAKKAGARTILINAEAVKNSVFDEVIIGKSEEILPALFNMLPFAHSS